MSLAHAVSVADKRIAHRVVSSRQVVVQLTVGEQVLEGVLRDLSISGMGVVLSGPCPLGQKCGIRIAVPMCVHEGLAPVNCRGVVRHVRDIQGEWVLGLELVDIEGDDFSALAALVRSLAAERSRLRIAKA